MVKTSCRRVNFVGTRLGTCEGVPVCGGAEAGPQMAPRSPTLFSGGRLTLAIGLITSLLAASAHSQTWDIRNDWSDVNNPNGPWSLRLSDGDLMTSTVRTNGWSTPQPSWG